MCRFLATWYKIALWHGTLCLMIGWCCIGNYCIHLKCFLDPSCASAILNHTTEIKISLLWDGWSGIEGSLHFLWVFISLTSCFNCFHYMVSSPLLPYYFCLSPSPWDTHTGRVPGRCAYLSQLATSTLSGACPVLVKKAQTVSCAATASHPVGTASEARLPCLPADPHWTLSDLLGGCSSWLTCIRIWPPVYFVFELSVNFYLIIALNRKS